MSAYLVPLQDLLDEMFRLLEAIDPKQKNIDAGDVDDLRRQGRIFGSTGRGRSTLSAGTTVRPATASFTSRVGKVHPSQGDDGRKRISPRKSFIEIR